MKKFLFKLFTNPEFLRSLLLWWGMCLDNPLAAISIIVVLGGLGAVFYWLETKRLVALEKLKR
jgi:hypothetical protein